MSEMQVFIGRFEQVDSYPAEFDTFSDDQYKREDQIYEWEDEHKTYFIKIDDKLFKVWSIADADSYGFDIVLPPGDRLTLVLYWYNGGAGFYEVVERTIRRYLE